MGITSIIVQIFLGILLIVAVYVLSLKMLRQDRLVHSDEKIVLGAAPKDHERRTLILDGYAITNVISNTSWTTVSTLSPNYRSLPRSLNRYGGAQFSYSFWMSLESPSNDKVKGKTILLRGDRSKYTVHKKPNPTGQYVASQEFVVKTPLIRFGDSYDEFVVELNTTDDPFQKVTFSPDESPRDSTLRKNAISLSAGRWALYTFTFADNYNFDFEDGIMVRMYVNDTLYGAQVIPNKAIRHNDGDLYVLPTHGDNDQGIANGRIGDIRYWNYAVSEKEISEIFRRGPPNHPASIMKTVSDPIFLSEYNKLDIYNM